MVPLPSPCTTPLTPLAALAALACLTLPAQALTVDTGPGLATGGGISLYDDRNYANGGYQHLAGLFTVAVNDVITSVQGWLNWNYGGTLHFSLMSNFQGLPGARLFTVQAPLAPTQINTPDWRGVGGLNWAVQPGSYWLVFEDGRDPGSGNMPGGASTPLAGYASSPGLSVNGGWSRADVLGLAMRINTFPEPPPAPYPAVPEPGRGALLIGGLMLTTLACRRRNHKA